MYYFPNLDDTIRLIMITELEMNLKNGLFYVPKSIKVDFVCTYKKLLKSTFEKGDVASLKRNLIPNFFKDRDKNGKKIPSNINEIIAFSDFNRYYMRAILIRAINENKSVIVYRAKQSLNERAESKKLVGTCKRPVLGNIPNELINFTIQKYPKSQRSNVIKSIQESFTEASRELRSAMDKLKNGNCADFEINIASKNIQAGLKDILPADSKIAISVLGEGEFGCAFKVSITDNFGNKLMHDRAIKIYKPFKSSGRMSAETKLLVDRLHWINAEANSAYRLQNILGHNINKQNCVQQEFFDLEHGFSISQMADNELPEVTSSIDFSKLGLKPLDLHNGNIVNGRIIDCGGFIAHDVLSDKTILKYYKKIMNRNNLDERQALIDRYSNMILNPKTPHRDKIRQAIELAKKDSLEDGYKNFASQDNPIQKLIALTLLPKGKDLESLKDKLLNLKKTKILINLEYPFDEPQIPINGIKERLNALKKEFGGDVNIDKQNNAVVDCQNLLHPPREKFKFII